MSLPIDVVDYTLSFLHSDRVTLKTCAQSHPTLSRLSERYIYANVILHDDLDKFDPLEDLRTSEFTQIIAKTPDIAHHVRNLTICVTDKPVPEQGQATSSHLDTVASLLATFSGLTKLTIKGNAQNPLPFSWSTLPETFHQAFLHFLHRQAMKDVVIFHAAFFPLALLNNCKYVRATLDKCEETQYDNEESTEDMLLPSSHPARAFEHLSIRHCSQTCRENIAAWVETHNLRSLKYKGLRGVSEIRNFIPEVLFACSNSLTELHLDVEDYFRSWFSFSNNSVIYDEGITHFPFTLAGLYNLERLTIDARLHSYASNPAIGRSETHHSPIPAIVEFISTASSSSPFLKQIFLNFCYIFWGFGILDPGVVWVPFVPLAAKCSSLAMTVNISPRFKSREWQGEHPADLSSLTDYRGLKPYVEKGVVVVTTPEE